MKNTTEHQPQCFTSNFQNVNFQKVIFILMVYFIDTNISKMSFQHVINVKLLRCFTLFCSCQVFNTYIRKDRVQWSSTVRYVAISGSLHNSLNEFAVILRLAGLLCVTAFQTLKLGMKQGIALKRLTVDSRTEERNLISPAKLKHIHSNNSQFLLINSFS